MRAYDGIKAERGREVTLETPDFLEHARVLLSKNLAIAIRMSGSSMRPSIEDGDIVLIEPLADELVKTGDVILYHSQRDTAVIHRVIRIEKSASERAVITRGDAAAQNDSPVPYHRVLGRVQRVERAGEHIDLRRPRRPLLKRLVAWLKHLRFWLF